MKRWALALVISIATPLSFARAAEADFVSLNKDTLVTVSTRPDNFPKQWSSDGRAGRTSGTLVGTSIVQLSQKRNISLQPVFGSVNGVQIALSW
jgi:hypothetical protein